MTLYPAENYTLAQIIPPENKTVGGLILPDTSKNKLIRAVVLHSYHKDYSCGDHIFYEKHRDIPIQDEDGTDLVLIKDEYIIAKIHQ